MLPFMFVIHGIPKEKDSEFSFAYIHIWVIDSDIDNAEIRAREYISSYNWIPQETEHAFEILPEQLPQLGAAESMLYHQACQYGIAADFVAVPSVEGKPNDPVQIRPFQK